MKKVFLIYSELLTILAGITIGLIVNMEAILDLLHRFSWRWVVPYSWGSIVATIILSASIFLLFWNIIRLTKKEEGAKKSDADSAKKEAVEKKEAIEKKEKSKKEDSTGWNFFKLAFGFSLFAGLLCWVVFVAYKNFMFTGNNAPRSSQTPAYGSFEGVPAEIALPIICGCESSGKPGVLQHYEPGSTTELLKNKQGSDARGECQIKFGLHLKDAKEKYGLDLEVKKDYWEYAKILYNESTPHTKPWEGEPGNTTKGCWAPKLAALGFDQEVSSQASFTKTVEAPVGKPSEEVDLPVGFEVKWGGSEGSFLVETNLGGKAIYDPPKNIFESIPFNPDCAKLKFKSLGEKPAQVKLRFKKIST